MSLGMGNRPMCEKMSISPARDNLSVFLRKICLYITYIGKGIIPALAKKGFDSILLNVDHNCYKTAEDRTEK